MKQLSIFHFLIVLWRKRFPANGKQYIDQEWMCLNNTNPVELTVLQSEAKGQAIA